MRTAHAHHAPGPLCAPPWLQRPRASGLLSTCNASRQVRILSAVAHVDERQDRDARAGACSYQPRWYRRQPYVLQTSAEVVREVASAAGTSSVYKSSAIERAVRDVETLRQHGLGAEGRFANVAQAYWNAEIGFPFLAMD